MNYDIIKYTNMKFKATISYIIAIIFLNVLFVKLPYIYAYGEGFSPADVLVGIIYIVRDFAQREIKHHIFFAMLIGCILSYLLSEPTIAIASVSGFAIGELIDWALFTYTQKPLSQRLILSSCLSSPIDTLVFLLVAKQFNILSFLIMIAGKWTGILMLWIIWKRRHKKINPEFSVHL